MYFMCTPSFSRLMLNFDSSLTISKRLELSLSIFQLIYNLVVVVHVSRRHRKLPDGVGDGTGGSSSNQKFDTRLPSRLRDDEPSPPSL